MVIAAGVYMPQPEQLLAIRRHMQQEHAAMRSLLNDKSLRRLMPEFDNNPLQRMPKGFAAEDPAADLLLCRQWALSTRLPVDVATTPALVPEILKRFRSAAPMVALLNTPLLPAATRRRSLF